MTTIDKLPKTVHNDFAVRITEHEKIDALDTTQFRPVTTTLTTDPTIPSLIALFGDPYTRKPFATFTPFHKTPSRNVFWQALFAFDSDKFETILNALSPNLSEGVKRQRKSLFDMSNLSKALSRTISDMRSFFRYHKG